MLNLPEIHALYLNNQVEKSSGGKYQILMHLNKNSLLCECKYLFSLDECNSHSHPEMLNVYFVNHSVAEQRQKQFFFKKETFNQKSRNLMTH